MEESTRKLSVDLTNMVYKQESYITTHQLFEEFSIANSLEDLAMCLHSPNSIGTRGIELDFVDTDEMISDETKVIMYVQDTIYHFFIDSLALILKIHKEHPGTQFVLYLQKARYSKSIDDFYKLLFIVLDGEGIKYKTVSTTSEKDYAPVYKFNNYVCIDRNVTVRNRWLRHHLISFLDVKHMADIVIKHSKKYMNVAESVEPFRKLYISRESSPADLGPVVEGYPDYKDDKRMNDLWKLEEFFVSMGYDAFRPEKQFSSIMEQIVYMTEVKTLASITSSGLANMIFMQPNQTIIEIQAELVQAIRFDDDTYVYPEQRLHNHYSTLAFMQEHTYTSIPSRRDPDKVIQAITSGLVSYLI
jgi:hypothetical protein